MTVVTPTTIDGGMTKCCNGIETKMFKICARMLAVDVDVAVTKLRTKKPASARAPPNAAVKVIAQKRPADWKHSTARARKERERALCVRARRWCWWCVCVLCAIIHSSIFGLHFSILDPVGLLLQPAGSERVPP